MSAPSVEGRLAAVETVVGQGTDTSSLTPLHTLGAGHYQAAPGDHTHQPLHGVVLSGSRASGAALGSVIAALVALGAVDSTTP